MSNRLYYSLLLLLGLIVGYYATHIILALA